MINPYLAFLGYFFFFSLSFNLLHVSRIGLKISAGRTNQHKLWEGQSRAAKVYVRCFGGLSCETGGKSVYIGSHLYYQLTSDGRRLMGIES